MAALYRSCGYQTKAVNEARLSSRRSSAADRLSVKRDYTCGCCCRALINYSPNDTVYTACSSNVLVHAIVSVMRDVARVSYMHQAIRLGLARFYGNAILVVLIATITGESLFRFYKVINFGIY